MTNRNSRHVVTVEVAIQQGLVAGWYSDDGTTERTGPADAGATGRDILIAAVAATAEHLEPGTELRVTVSRRTTDRLFHNHTGALTLGDGRQVTVTSHRGDRLRDRLTATDWHQDLHRAIHVVACDGSVDARTGVALGVWACHLGAGNVISGPMIDETRSDRAELEALCQALERTNPDDPLAVLTDCRSVADIARAVLEGRNPKTARGDQWDRFRAAAAGRRVTVRWVRGHAGHGTHTPADLEARRRLRAERRDRQPVAA